MPTLPAMMLRSGSEVRRSGQGSFLAPQPGSPTGSFQASTPPNSVPQSPTGSFAMPSSPLPSSPLPWSVHEKEHLDVLLQCPFFKKLGNQVARRLSGMVHSLHCESGTVLFRQGDPPGNCYVILEGRVGIYVKPDEETQPDIDSREGTPRDGPPLRMQRETTGEGPFSDALSDSSDDRDSLNLTNPFRRPENESRRSSAARSALNSSMDIASRRSSVKSGRRVSYERQSSSNLEEEPMSRRTSLEWTESKGSGEMNASIQDPSAPASRRSSHQSHHELRRCSTESRFSERADSKKSNQGREDDRSAAPSRRSSQQSGPLRRCSTESRFSERADSKKSQGGRDLSKSLSLGRSRGSLVLNIPEDQHSERFATKSSVDDMRRQPSHELFDSCQTPGGRSQRSQETIIRTKTHEGFSVSHPNSRFGTQVVQLTRGQLFGELALMGDQPRAGSAQCLEDTQFLVITRQDFDSLLKSDLGKQKDETTGFLRRHVPGMADLPEQSRFGKPHASYYFKHQSVPKGFVFMKQGERTNEKLWVLRRGVVEFWHLDPEAGGKLRPSSKQGARPRGRRIALLVEGGLFSAVPTNDLEPFTVVAQSLCEVFCVVKGDLKHLPYRVMTAIQDHLLQASMWRLNRCIEGRLRLQPQKPPKERVPVEEPKRRVLAELLHCDNTSDDPPGRESLALRQLKDGAWKHKSTSPDLRELRASSPASPRTGSVSPERRPARPEPRLPPSRPSSAAAKFYKLKSSYVNIGLRRSDGTVRTVTRVASASQLTRRAKAASAAKADAFAPRAAEAPR
ncbi:unnamed protein product [Durusdinium trenchii]|uniref:Cyclic nucleotide-binding domain-containing protein n=2 Tax=Durusdinium trenchii TaxID=1381693 RepID=A0ABP0Q2T8_9DINO